AIGHLVESGGDSIELREELGRDARGRVAVAQSPRSGREMVEWNDDSPPQHAEDDEHQTDECRHDDHQRELELPRSGFVLLPKVIALVGASAQEPLYCRIELHS